jgi:hypothetical protein
MTARGPDPAFVPISPNPYIVGNPVRERAMFFGREAEFEMVRNRFQHSEDCGLLVFCGERRSGKTSILFQILDHRLGPGFIPILIDMQSMAITNEADFLERIAEEVLVALGPRAEGIARPDFGEGSSHAVTFQKFIARTLRHCPDKKLILLFDEYELFENKIDAGALTRDTLGILSNLMEHHGVFLVFTGSQHLDQRHRDYWNILLAKSTWKQISYLERSDVQKLIRNPVAGRATYADSTVEAIFRLSAGQPFYTQALCQSLMDQLNERKTREVTLEILAEVVQGLVSTPLPQMIFLWESLGQDEKLALALLAEGVASDTEAASDDALVKLIHRRDYPLDMNRDRIAAALENLFRAELLTKDDRVQPPAYAFRMDLWRLWIRRMHSVWQVMREIGLEIRRPKGLRIGHYRVTPLAAGVALFVAGLSWGVFHKQEPPSPILPDPTGVYVLVVEPPEASIELPGQATVTGMLRATLPAEREFLVSITAPGFADTTLPVRIAKGDTVQQAFSMQPLFGDLRIETSPAGAQVTVDGTVRGVSPVMVRGLPLAKLHEVDATLPGRAPVHRTERLTLAGGTTIMRVTLDPGTTELMLTSEPPGATILMDGEPRGTAPAQLSNVPYGRHKFSARLSAFTVLDSTVEVSAATSHVHFVLTAEAPGVLIIQGDKPASIFVDGVRIAEGLSFARATLRPGTHRIRVELRVGDAITKSLVVSSGDNWVFEFTTGQLRNDTPRNP